MTWNREDIWRDDIEREIFNDSGFEVGDVVVGGQEGRTNQQSICMLVTSTSTGIHLPK